MKSVARMAFGAALAIGASSTLSIPSAAHAQAGVSLTRAERESLLALQTALNTGNYAAASAALPAARAAAASPLARTYLTQAQYQIAVRNNDHRAQADALDALIASGNVPAASIPGYYSQLGSISYNYLRNYGRAEQAFTAQVQAAPNDTDGLTNLAKVKRDLKKPMEALPLMTRAIAARRASGQMVPESWYKMAMDIAYTGKAGPQAAVIGRDFVAAYPTRENWRDVLLIQRELQGADSAAGLDIYRLMRASKALSGERDYFEMAAALEAAGFPGEARAVIEEGAAARMVDKSKGAASAFLTPLSARITREKASLPGLQTRALADPTGALALKTGDTLFGYGDYAKAASLYQAALQKGSVDANLVNSRLGMALALAGQRTEAEAALRMVSGNRADLAGYWLAWLARRS